MYRVKDWNEAYETPESRKLKNTRYVPVPNKQDGKGFRRIQLHPRRVELFCAWNLIIQVASKCPERGTLADRDGLITPADLELKTGFPEDLFAFAYEFFSSGGKLAWLAPIQEAPGDSWRPPENLPSSAGIPADDGKPDFTPISRGTGESPGTPLPSAGIARNLPIDRREGREGKELTQDARAKSAKEEYWDFLVDLFQLEVLAQRDELRLYEQCAEFRQRGATCEDIGRRARRYREKWPEMAFTVNAVLSNWDALKPAPSFAPARNLL